MPDRFDNHVCKIQLMKINFKSMAEIFLSYHSGIVCVAFDIINNNYIYMPQRFGKMNFNNYLSIAGKSKIESVISKYKKRFQNFYLINQYLITNIVLDVDKAILHKIFGFGNDFFYSLDFMGHYQEGDYVNLGYIMKNGNEVLNNIYRETAYIENIFFLDAIYMAYKLFCDLPPTNIYSGYIENTKNIKSIGISCANCSLYLGSYSDLYNMCQQGIKTFTIYNHYFFESDLSTCTYDESQFYSYRCPEFELSDSREIRDIISDSKRIQLVDHKINMKSATTNINHDS